MKKGLFTIKKLLEILDCDTFEEFFDKEIERQKGIYSNLSIESLKKLLEGCNKMCKMEKDRYWLEFCKQAKIIKKIIDEKST
jgi:hypothetical protein